MAARGLVVSYETVRRWCEKFGKAYAHGRRRRRARTGDNGIWTKSVSRSTASLTTSGER